MALIRLDDVIVFKRKFDEHLNRIELVFQGLVESGFKIKGSKWIFFQKHVSLLGQIIFDSLIKVDTKKRTAERMKSHRLYKTSGSF